MSDSEWNKDILSALVDRFCYAVLDFCHRDGPLRYHWVKYLPFGRALDRHSFWKNLPLRIVERLSNENILYIHGGSELRRPAHVRTLPVAYQDQAVNGSPLFTDLTESRVRYLSSEYGSENITIFKKLFRIHDIEDLAMCHRIEHDLDQPNSRIKDRGTSNRWHTRAACLITSILERSRARENSSLMIILVDLPLIPLNNGQWIAATDTALYLPADIGPVIPLDIISTIDPRSTENDARKEMCVAFGASRCPPTRVVDKVWLKYSRQGVMIDLSSSKAHLNYLYWHVENTFDRRFRNMWIYDHDGRKIEDSTRSPVYLPSDNEYGPDMLFRRSRPGFGVSFLNPEYLILVPPIVRQTRRQDISWTEWLKRTMEVRDIPRLVSRSGLLPAEFRYILDHLPDKIVGTLQAHWRTYRQQMTPLLMSQIKSAQVSCWGVQTTQLKSTYCPTEDLENECTSLGINVQFPILSRRTLSRYTDAPEDWTFLRQFGVQFETSVHFYLEVVRQHKAVHQSAWVSARADILKTYSAISDHSSEANNNVIV
jgi:hypothetical protein